ncbi:MAG: stress response translation initiation inhibitor YciH [Candidatus Baldrarchaeia archaeon]
MSEICPVCGLPQDLCVCKEIAKEEQRIKIRLEKRKWGREVTIIEGFDEKEVDLDRIASRLKQKCACGGTIKNGRIELQGDHRQKAKQILIELGFQESNIDIT